MVELHASAMELGQVCFPLHKMRKQLGTAIARRMCQRKGSLVYQSAAFSLDNFLLQAAQVIFPQQLETYSDKSITTWRASTQAEVKAMTASLLAESDYSCADAARALKTKSERVFRVIAQILPGMEVSLVLDSEMELGYT